MKFKSLRERLGKKGRILITIAVLVIVFIGFEANQRIREYRKTKKGTRGPYSTTSETSNGSQLGNKGGSIALVFHPHLIYKFKQDQRTSLVNINAQGFRGRDWSKERSSASRIIVLGGSATFGVNASSDEKVFTGVLERLLNDDDPGRAEVYNAGVTGYGSKQELILLATELLDYQPDLVVIFDGWNDFYFGGVRPEGIVDAISPSYYEFDEILSRYSQRWTNVFRVSAFFRYLEKKVREATAASGPPRRFGHYSDNVATYLPEYRKNLTRMVRLARANGVDVILVPQPELYHRKGKIPKVEQELRKKFNQEKRAGYEEYARTQYPAFIEAAREVAAAEGVPFVDSTAAFDDFKGVAFTDFVHYTDRGNEALARYLLPAVSKVLDERARLESGSPDRHSKTAGGRAPR
ncbi:MAG: SGNH/GDSL hydrolase family protein [Planctomycetota bacterium]|jgi:lysophospholipase L1-like esterase